MIDAGRYWGRAVRRDMGEPRASRFRFRPLRLRDALAASRWRYPGQYAMYNLDLAPLLVAVALRGPLSTLAGVSYYAVLTSQDALAGVFSLTRRGSDVEIGVGLRPDLNGRGLGLPYLLDGLALGRERYHPQTFSLHVATFNSRAITVYERAGFRAGQVTPLLFQGKRYEEMRMSRRATDG
jgi:[ribosomal protein S18]-alanine N-acetyltransferase